MNGPDPRKVEVLKVWYSVFCTLVDAHRQGEYTEAELVVKMCELRQELINQMPEVESMMKTN
jgi:hypothetical protein